MEKEIIILELPKVALEWIRKVAELEKSENIEKFLEGVILQNLSLYLSNDDNGFLGMLGALSVIKDGLIGVFLDNGVDLPDSANIEEILTGKTDRRSFFI